MERRAFTAGLLGTTVLTVGSLGATEGSATSGGSWKTTHSGVFFIGTMPWVRLFEADRQTCWASIVQADWSVRGTGRLMILRRDGRRRVLGDNEALFAWLGEWLLQSDGNPEGAFGADVRFEQTEVDLQIDPESGLRAVAKDIRIEMSTPFERRLIRRERYPLGDFFPTASWVRIACAHASVTEHGKAVPGTPGRSVDSFGPSSSAQINVAEVWTI